MKETKKQFLFGINVCLQSSRRLRQWRAASARREEQQSAREERRDELVMRSGASQRISQAAGRREITNLLVVRVFTVSRSTVGPELVGHVRGQSPWDFRPATGGVVV